MIHLSRISLFCLMLLMGVPLSSAGQINQDYIKANQLYRQQNFKEAYALFAQLHRENPDNFTFLEKATESLMQMKKYEQAVDLLQGAEQADDLQPQATIQLAEVYHVRGDTSRAFALWDQTLQKHSQNRQARLEVARSLQERRAFGRAIEVYEHLSKDSPESNLIITELADTYLQAGSYDQAIRHFLQLLRQNPNQISYIQNRLMRFRDEQVYDVATTEINALLEDLSAGHPAYQRLQQLEVWLLMEQKHFDRALVTAQRYEQASPNVSYLLYSLGDKLLAENEFELAEQAYSFYIDQNIEGTKYRSMEELAGVYRQWAEYLERHNLSTSSDRKQLYNQAFSTLDQLRREAASYQRTPQVLIALSELSLDILHQPGKAREYHKELQQFTDGNLSAQIKYLEGRLFLYEQNYNNARRVFTDSYKQSDNGSHKQKSRYYLALTDFYAGDYEFANIQLQALEREHTSFYANNAIQLRLWIQRGLQADSTGKDLAPLAQAVEHFSQGKHQLGINELKPLFQKQNSHPLAPEALLELNKHKETHQSAYVYRMLSGYLSSGDTSSPLHERLLWERASLGDRLVTNEDFQANYGQNAGNDAFRGRGNEEELPISVEHLIPLYEEILMHYPNGFYAPFVRERLQELQNFNT